MTPKNYTPKSDEVVVVPTSAPVYNKDVKLQSLIDARLSYDGRISGKHYVWDKAGSVVAVDALDAPYLLEKRIKSLACCSGDNVNQAIFQAVD